MKPTTPVASAKPKRRAARPPATPAKGFDKGAFYRLCRMLHAYLSAFAFLALIFFSATGLLVDHPEWMQGRARETEVKLAIPAAVLTHAKAMPDPSAYLAAETAKLIPLAGVYRSGEVIDGQANLRFEGVKGSSTVLVDLASGKAEVTTEHPSALTVMGDLHRGKNASLPWKLVIDISAILVLALSLIGYVLFFSLRFRLRTSLILTGASLAFLAAIFVWLTP